MFILLSFFLIMPTLMCCIRAEGAREIASLPSRYRGQVCIYSTFPHIPLVRFHGVCCCNSIRFLAYYTFLSWSYGFFSYWFVVTFCLFTNFGALYWVLFLVTLLLFTISQFDLFPFFLLLDLFWFGKTVDLGLHRLFCIILAWSFCLCLCLYSWN